MKREEIICKQTGDKIVKIKHSSGLEIYISEMTGFRKSFAIIGTRYGSINNKFKTCEDNEFTEVPEGIAHYLEHKLFENEDLDAFAQYAKTGASANAFTSYDKTCYYFSCNDNFYESLKILLHFVTNPYFTKETIDKEQGIIGQEIQMTNDNPSWRLFSNLMNCLYKNHPVKIDIAGTIESITKINKDLLYKCYNTFYNLNNMVLSIAGNADEKKVLKICDEFLKPCEDKKIKNKFPDEPKEIVRKKSIEKMSVGVPIFYIGFKLNPNDIKNREKNSIMANIILSMLTDTTSEFYNKLLEEGLVNTSFSSEVFEGEGYFSLLIGGESNDPDKVFELIKIELERMKKDGIDREHFEEIKLVIYGGIIRGMNNVETVAMVMESAGLRKINPFLQMEILSKLKVEEIDEFLRDKIDIENSSISIIRNGDAE